MSVYANSSMAILLMFVVIVKVVFSRILSSSAILVNDDLILEIRCFCSFLFYLNFPLISLRSYLFLFFYRIYSMTAMLSLLNRSSIWSLNCLILSSLPWICLKFSYFSLDSSWMSDWRSVCILRLASNTLLRNTCSISARWLRYYSRSGNLGLL